MEHDISLGFLLRIFKKAWWKIAIIALAALLIVSVLSGLLIDKKYSASIECYVINTNTSYDYTSTSLLGASTYLINDYVSILKSETILKQVQEKLAEQGWNGVTIGRLRGMIESSSNENTSVFTLTLVDTQKDLVTATAKVIADLAPVAITDIVKANSQTHKVLANNIYAVIDYYNQKAENGGLEATEEDITKLLESEQLGINTRQNCIEVLTPPKEATEVSRNIMTYGLLGAIVAAVATYLFFLLRHLFELNISSEEDIKKMINRPLIGTVPHWDIPQAKK